MISETKCEVTPLFYGNHISKLYFVHRYISVFSDEQFLEKCFILGIRRQ